MTKRAKALDLALSLYRFYRESKSEKWQGFRTYSLYSKGKVRHYSTPEEIRVHYQQIVKEALK